MKTSGSAFATRRRSGRCASTWRGCWTRVPARIRPSSTSQSARHSDAAAPRRDAEPDLRGAAVPRAGRPDAGEHADGGAPSRIRPPNSSSTGSSPSSTERSSRGRNCGGLPS